MHPQFFTLHPARPPSWRAERVQSLLADLDQPQRPSRWDDKYVRTYLKFLLDYRRAEQNGQEEIEGTLRTLDDSAAIARLFGRKPELWYAHQIHTNPDTEWRSILQARLLTGFQAGHAPQRPADVGRRDGQDGQHDRTQTSDS